MKSVLIIYPLFPYPINHGGNLRIYNLLKELKKEPNISVSLVTIITEKTTQSEQNIISELVDNLYFVKNSERPINILSKFKTIFSIYPRAVISSFDINFLNLLKSLIKSKSFNCIHFDSLFTYKYLKALIKFDAEIKQKSLFAIVDSVSLFYQLKLRNARNPFVIIDSFFEFIRSIYLEFSLNHLTSNLYIISNLELKYLKHLYRGKIFMSPNGINTELFKPLSVVKQSNSLVFTGNLSFSPNQDALQIIIKKILPILAKRGINYSFYAVGSNPPKWLYRETIKNKNIVVTGYVEDMNYYLNKCQIYISWMNTGSGVKNKILEALACGIPVIANYHSVKGIIQSISSSTQLQYPITIAENYNDMADKIEEILNNYHLKGIDNTKSIDFVKRYFSWTNVTKKFVEVYNQTYNS